MCINQAHTNNYNYNYNYNSRPQGISANSTNFPGNATKNNSRKYNNKPMTTLGFTFNPTDAA
jgi:hypothetical protein